VKCISNSGSLLALIFRHEPAFSKDNIKKIILKANQDTQVIVMLQLLVFLDILFIEYQSLQFFVCYLVITLMKLNGDIVLFFLLVFAPHLDQHDYQCNQDRLG
jgi:hypothetical protein